MKDLIPSNLSVLRRVVEFPNGDEVATTLVYERLDKHCTKCLRLDHELKECLVARAEARAIKESQGEKLEKSNNFSAQESGSLRGHPSGQNLDTQYRREREQRNQGAFQFSASNKARPDPPTRSYYREIQRSVAEAKDTGSSISKLHQDRNNRGSPLVLDAVTIPEKTLDEARNEVRDMMMQYTKCSNPTEREARKERLRQAEVRGQVEEAVVQVARASLNAMANEQMLIPLGTSPERISATQRLGPTVQQVAPKAKDQEAETNPTSREKAHVSLRLGESQKSPISKSRTPATLRLGPVGTPEAQDTGDLVTAKRKPGRPPGRRVVHASPTLSKGNSTKRRTVQATKPPTCRRKIIPAETRGGTKPAKDKFKGDGASINIWDNPWLSLEKPLQPMGPATQASAMLVVKDLIHADRGEWNRGLIQTVLPHWEDQILLLQPSVRGAPDILTWLARNKFLFENFAGNPADTLSMAIVAAREWVGAQQEKELKSSPTSIQGTEEQVDMVIRSDAAWSVTNKCAGLGWVMLTQAQILRGHKGASFVSSALTAEALALREARCLPPVGVSDTMLVPWILWSIWKARNKFLFENFAGNPADTLSMAIVAAREWIGAQQEKEVKSSPTSIQGTEEQVDMVIRSDAAWSVTNKCADLGWVMLTQAQILRGHKGASFVSSALTAEALALREAVKFGHDMNLKRVRFESDSAHLIKAINKREPDMELYGILEDILHLSNEFDVVVFGWISRESNGVADLLAKNTLSLYEQEVAGEELILPPNN
ncbi:hypothetical protein F2Q69_00005552 [Brassica cretica]|uniref:RNase H type-1 domain-containing protein n=1 Tax=Brassica cretica TaxID=69181 RepID=A0A8S9P3I4_BRACR|nr:hypothetical protein F2Q69_00005552 [Brassica cretica]